MKHIGNLLLDLLYELYQILIIVVVIVAVVFIIRWRMNILFDKTEHQAAQTTTSEARVSQTKGDNAVPSNHDISVLFPESSSSKDYAKILKDVGILNDEKKFIDLVQSNKLEGKLKHGEFKIKKGATPEEILKILKK